METMTVEAYRNMVARGANSAPSPKKRAAPEEDLQRACVQFAQALEQKHPLLQYLFHPANGGKRPRGEAGKLKALGVKPGVPDLLLPLPSPSGRWRGLALELKGPSGRLEADQERWLSLLNRKGWLVGTVWGFEDFQDFLSIFFAEATW
jgi:hypothetical protein